MSLEMAKTTPSKTNMEHCQRQHTKKEMAITARDVTNLNVSNVSSITKKEKALWRLHPCKMTIRDRNKHQFRTYPPYQTSATIKFASKP